MEQQEPNLLDYLAKERDTIVKLATLKARDKLALLEENRNALTVAMGGKVKKTQNFVYGILIFGGGVLVILALLTLFKDLPKEVILLFIGTVMGGVIGIIAQ